LSYPPLDLEGELTDISVAIKVFCDQNTISVDIELFKLANVTSPAGSDLSLTKNLIITFNGACNEHQRDSRAFNTINLDNLFTRAEATFPALQSIVVHTDGATSPSTSFFDIAHDCIRWPSHFTKIEFHAVGCFEATRNNGRYKVNVKYRELAELWQESLDMLPELRKRAWEHAVTMGDSLAGLVYRAIFARAVFENFGVDDLSILLGPPQETTETLTLFCPAFGVPEVKTQVFCTNLACPYRPCRSSLYLLQQA
jgi:hypothetical protein